MKPQIIVGILVIKKQTKSSEANCELLQSSRSICSCFVSHNSDHNSDNNQKWYIADSLCHCIPQISRQSPWNP